jgi:hypothetical protein
LVSRLVLQSCFAFAKVVDQAAQRAARHHDFVVTPVQRNLQAAFALVQQFGSAGDRLQRPGYAVGEKPAYQHEQRRNGRAG